MKYRTIVADPPWPQASGGPRSITNKGTTWDHNSRKPSALGYPTMTVAEIGRLPVKSLAGEDSHLYLWVTNQHLEAGYAVARSWGFGPKTLLTWCKPPMGMGLGGAFVQTSEHIIFARRGRDVVRARGKSTWFVASRDHSGGHPNGSVKPPCFLDIVEQVSPGPYLELFARRQRLGWDTYGNECFNHTDMAVVERL